MIVTSPLSSLLGSDNDECKILPFRSELIIADDSLLLVDENDIRELSSSGLGRRLLEVSLDCKDS